jgi:ubiquitin carboxyl-terminal hydrolase 36/42
LDPKIAETTWVHKIFGGRLRSRVTCRECGHNSDTFDRVLDLSVDVQGVADLRGAMKGFTNVDVLKGANKYKCEKCVFLISFDCAYLGLISCLRCKNHVIAEKRFTIHEAPLVLSIHLKRFSPLGKKIGHPVQYSERLALAPYMSEESFGPTYALSGVISHAGGGPHSGHYYAHVRAPDGRWYEMNDDSVTRSPPPLGLKSAYVLFYLREGAGTGQAARSPSTANAHAPPASPTPIKAASKSVTGVTGLTPRSVQRAGGVVAGMKRRSEDGGTGDQRGAKAPRTDDIASPTKASKKASIGPLLPSGAFMSSKTAAPAMVTRVDSQATMDNRKSEAARSLQNLAQYQDASSEAEDLGNPIEEDGVNGGHTQGTAPPSSPTVPSSSVASILSNSFYGPSAGPKRLLPSDSEPSSDIEDEEAVEASETGGPSTHTSSQAPAHPQQGYLTGNSIGSKKGSSIDGSKKDKKKLRSNGSAPWDAIKSFDTMGNANSSHRRRSLKDKFRRRR